MKYNFKPVPVAIASCTSSRSEVFCKKGVFKNFSKLTGRQLCQSLFFNTVAGLWPLLKKKLCAKFSCEFCEILENTFFHRTPSGGWFCSCNACSIKMWLHQQFFTYWKDNNIPNTLKNKQKKLELTDMIKFGELPSLPLENPSVVTLIQCLYYLYVDNKLASGVNELRCRMFIKRIRAKIFYHQL